MKKNYFFIACLSVGFQINAQLVNEVVTFETLPLTGTETFYNGSDDAGSFEVNYATFSNNYNADWNSWNGFAYSNVTDNTTAGFANQYSAFPGSGANNSEKYAIHYPEGIITFPFYVQLDSIKLSNATYAALSMRDGDAYGKQFGSLTNAAGEVDGTNGEDFFKVWIIGLDENYEPADSLEFYLADYRFENDADDYILDTWKNVDLHTLMPVRHLTFRLESSDNGDWGMNTPAYFAIDDLAFHSAWGLKENQLLSFDLFPNPATDRLFVSGVEGEVEVLDLTGKVVFTNSIQGKTEISVADWQVGVYQVRIRNSAGLTGTSKFVKL